MKNYMEFTGKTLDDAINDARSYFGVEREKLEIEIVNDAKTGIFGLVGAKKATIRARRVQLADIGLNLGRAEKRTSVAPAASVANIDRPEQAQRPAKPEKQDKQDKLDKQDKQANSEKSERPDSPEKQDKQDKQGKQDKPDRQDNRQDSPARPDRQNRQDKQNRPDRQDRLERQDKSARPEKQDRQGRQSRPVASGKPGQPGHSGQPGQPGQSGQAGLSGQSSQAEQKRRPGAKNAPDGRSHERAKSNVKAASQPLEAAFADDAAPDFEDQLPQIPLESINPEELRSVVLETLSKLIHPIVGEAETVFSLAEGRVNLQVHCADNHGLLIGRDGQTLASLQYLLSCIASRRLGASIRVQIDAGDYREKQDEKLRELALSLAEKVKSSSRPQSTRPLSAYHRRIIHMTLQDDPEVQTHSKGEGGLKRVVVVPRRKPAVN